MGKRRQLTGVVGILAIMALAVALRLYNLGSQPLWLDEAASLHFARLPLARQWSWEVPIDPGNPPLYYSLLHLWLVFGDSESSLRALSVIASVVTVPVVYLLGSTIADRRLGLLAALLLATSPLHVRYAQEARTYALFILTATVALWGVATLLKSAERGGPLRGRTTNSVGWAAYVGGAGLSLLAHNTAFFLVVGANLLVLAWLAAARWEHPKLVMRWFLAQVALIGIWAAWLPAYMRQTETIHDRFWISTPSFKDLVMSAHELAASYVLAPPLFGQYHATLFLSGMLLATLLGVGMWSWRRSLRWAVFAAVFMLTAPLGEVIVSWVWRPIFIARSLLWTTVPLYLLVAAGCLHLLRRPRLALAALAALALIQGWGVRNYFQDQKEAWDLAADYVGREVRQGDAIFFTGNVTQAAFDHYYRRADVPEFGIPVSLESDRWDEIPVGPQDVPAIEAIASRFERVWLVYSHEYYTDPEEVVPQALHAVGDVEQAAKFHDVEVRRYEIDKQRVRSGAAPSRSRSALPTRTDVTRGESRGEP